MQRTSEGEGSAGAKAPPRAERGGAERALSATSWLVRFLLALFVFVGALEVMKQGAGQLGALHDKGLFVRNALSTLGLGWLGALLVLSGSPVAASALTLVAGGTITELQGFTMVTGSRLGAAFVVLVVAMIYALRGGRGKRMAPVSTAIIALATTAVVYVPGAVIGYGLLKWPAFRQTNLQLPAQFDSVIDVLYGPLLTRLENLPAAVLFVGGLALLLLAFKLVDSVLPDMSDEGVGGSRRAWLQHKWGMFAVGCLVALVTMSVSVALSVLVPLVSKSYVKREMIVPYIMGANITTLGDTLLAAFLLRSAAAVRIVLASIVGTTIVSLLILALVYPQTRRAIWKFQRVVVKQGSQARLAAFAAALFLVPVAMISASGTLP